jgi:hypothetical protein
MAWHHEDCWVEGGVVCSSCGFTDEVEEEAELEESSEEELEESSEEDSEEEFEEEDFEEDELGEEEYFEPEPPGFFARLSAQLMTAVTYAAIAVWGVAGAGIGLAISAGLTAAIFGEPNPFIIVPVSILSYVVTVWIGMRAARIR